MSNIHAPLGPGEQMPDGIKNVSNVVTMNRVLTDFFGEDAVRWDPNSQIPISAETFRSFNGQKAFPKMVVRTYNVIENLSGWWTFFAPVRRDMEYRQNVTINIYPKRPLIRTTEEVPPDMWTHRTEQVAFTMDRYSASIEVLGDIWAHGPAEALEVVTEKGANIIGGTAISLKMKTTATFQRMKLPLQIKNTIIEPTFNTIREYSAQTRASYGSFNRTDKSIYSTIGYANQYASQQNFVFNGMVVPHGTLEPIARNKFHTNSFLVGGDNAIEFLAMGAKKLTDVLNRIQIFEDAKWALAGVSDGEVEAFVHNCMHGGYIYNNGNEPCHSDDDPKFKYGFEYLHAGKKNWAVKTLLTMYKEGGHFSHDGSLTPHHNEVAENIDNICRLAKIQIVDGLVDPYLYRFPNAANDSRIKVKYAIARFMGEVDPRFSPYEKLNQHVNKMKHIMSRRMGQDDFEDMMTLDAVSKELNEVDNINPSMNAWLAGISMSTENRRPTETAPYLNVKGLNSAPMPLYTQKVEDVRDCDKVEPIGWLVDGVTDAMYFIDESNVKNYICVVKLDTVVNDHSRGPENADFMYVAIPANSLLFNGQRLDTASGAGAGAWGSATTRAVTALGAVVPEDPTDYINVGASADNVNFDKTAARADFSHPRSNVMSTGWKLWNTAGIGRVGYFLQQGYKPPKLAQAPSKPYFYGAINGLRVLANMYKNDDYRGWPRDFLLKVYKGVVAWDKFMNVMYDIYTELNLYFDASMVPEHMKTISPTNNRLNAAISGLWGEFYKPILVRASAAGKFVNDYQYVPVGFPDFLRTRTDTAETMNTDIITILEGVGAVAGLAHGNAATAGRNEYKIATAFSTMVDVGMLGDRARAVFFDTNEMRQFVASFNAGSARSYVENVLARRDPITYGARNPASWTFSTFFIQELQPDLILAYDQLHGLAANTEKLATLLFRVALKLKKLLVRFADMDDKSKPLDIEISNQSLEDINERASGSKSAYAIESGAKQNVRDFMGALGKAKNTTTGRRLAGDGAVDPHAAALKSGESLAEIWVNSRLSASHVLWDNFRSDILEGERLASSGASDFKPLLKTLNVVARPANPADYTVPLGGYVLGEAAYNGAIASGVGVAPLNDSLKKVLGELKIQFEFASAKHGTRGTEIFGPIQVERQTSYENGGGMRGNVRDAEAKAHRLNNSVLQKSQERRIPEMFIHNEPIDRSTQNINAYLTPMIVKNENGGESVVYVEPHWLKSRMEYIWEVFRNDQFGRIFASLYCFSPNHLKVVERFLSNCIAPYGVGYIQTRPFIRDSVGAVLFGVGGSREVAECGMSAPISHITLDGPHNRWYIYWSIWLGCAVYQPDKFLWVLSQVMRRNLSGLTGEMYTNDEPFTFSANKFNKSGFMIAVGDNLQPEEIPEPFSITSQYPIERYGKYLNDRSIISKNEQHVPGLLYVISKFKLYNLVRGTWSNRRSFYDEKFANDVNVLVYSETCRKWDSHKKCFDKLCIGEWHYGKITPADIGWLDGVDMHTGSVSLHDMNIY